MKEQDGKSKSVVLAIGVALLCLLIGVVLSLRVPEVYRASATIQIGKIGYTGYSYNDQELIRFSHDRLLEPHLSLGEALRGRYRVAEAKKNYLPLPYLYHIEERPEGVLNLSARGNTREEAKEFLTSVVEWIIDRHKSMFEDGVSGINDFSADIYGLIENWSSPDSPRSLLLKEKLSKKEGGEFLELKDIKNIDFFALLEVYKTTHYALMPRHTARTAVVLPPIVEQKRVKPKLILYFVTSIIVAMFAGISAYVLFNVVSMIKRHGLGRVWDR